MDEYTKERFFRYVTKTDSCWLWKGGLDGGGYGVMKVNKIMKKAHRISWLIAGNTIPDDKPILRHKCRNRNCVSPEHLEVGTHTDNSSDKVRDGTVYCGEKHHRARLTPAQVLLVREREGERIIDLAKEFNTSDTTIYDIIHRRSWKHI
jgi:hypothetical protein